MGGRGSSSATADTGYQGKNKGSGIAQNNGSLTDLKRKLPGLQQQASTVYTAKSAQETINQLHNLKSEQDNVTIYRATPGNKINSGDWVFMSKVQAENFARSPFTGKAKPGYKVVKSVVKASDVGWTGKNLEFVYTGEKSTGKASKVKNIDPKDAVR